jgi:hypothetical protein
MLSATARKGIDVESILRHTVQPTEDIGWEEMLAFMPF